MAPLSEMSEDLSTLGKRLKHARILRGMTQPELGSHIGAESQQIWKYENDRREPSGQRLVQIAQALRVSPYWLALHQGPRDGSVSPAEPPEGVREFLSSDLATGLSAWSRRALLAMDWDGIEPDVGEIARLALELQRVRGSDG
ncbi:MAG: helix-turn-helix transcriptional regulator [Myxococcota bacterium]